LESDAEKREETSYLKRLWSLLRGKDAEQDKDEQIEKLLDEVEERGFIDEDQGDMIHNIIVLRDTTVREIMIPKGDMVALEVSSSLDDLVSLINREGCSRIPIYEEHMDNIVGIVYAKDILEFWNCDARPADLRSLMHPPYFVPEGKKLIDLLNEFRSNRPKLAIVIDEYGGTEGIITLEDILEEIVGDYEDEFTHRERRVKKLTGSAYEIDASMRIADLVDMVNFPFPEDDDYVTLAGLVYKLVGGVPSVGDVVPLESGRMTVLEMDNHRITLVRFEDTAQKSDGTVVLAETTSAPDPA